MNISLLIKGLNNKPQIIENVTKIEYRDFINSSENGSQITSYKSFPIENINSIELYKAEYRFTGTNRILVIKGEDLKSIDITY